ncbi:Riboflavin synthase [Desulfovibrionales bacterium]
MFTGLIHGLGYVLVTESKGHGTRLSITPSFVLTRLTIGESIAVNGVCLTVETGESRLGGWFKTYVSTETLHTTSLGQLRIGDRVHLEQALAIGDRLAGHLVSGHVDCLAKVAAVVPAGESLEFRIEFPPEFGPQVVSKGSVALDGISLTVNCCGDNYITVNIIPATQKKTTIADWQPGRLVNMETDLIGKYVQRMLGAWQEHKTPAQSAAGLTKAFLHKHGF